MSVPTLSPAENSIAKDAENPSLEIIRLSPGWQEGLKLFFQALRDNGDASFFCPHPTDEETISQLVRYNGRDLYYLLVEEDNILGYGLLRGWDEGYQIPSLGIAIHPSARGSGLAKVLMHFLHALVFRKGARKVRLRVLKNNEKAISLYRNIGYVFEEDAKQAEYLVGYKTLEKQ